MQANIFFCFLFWLYLLFAPNLIDLLFLAFDFSPKVLKIIKLRKMVFNPKLMVLMTLKFGHFCDYLENLLNRVLDRFGREFAAALINPWYRVASWARLFGFGLKIHKILGSIRIW